MNKKIKENPPEKVNAVKVWKSITGLQKEVRFTNENVKALQTNFSNVEAKIMQLCLNFKGLEKLNGEIETLKTEVEEKISTRWVVIIAVLLGAFVTFLTLVDRFVPK